MHRMTVSLPQDLYAHVKRVAEASRISEAAVVRSACAEVLPRVARVLDFLGEDPQVTPTEVDSIEEWMTALERFVQSAPEPMRQLIEDAFKDRS